MYAKGISQGAEPIDTRPPFSPNAQASFLRLTTGAIALVRGPFFGVGANTQLDRRSRQLERDKLLRELRCLETFMTKSLGLCWRIAVGVQGHIFPVEEETDIPSYCHAGSVVTITFSLRRNLGPLFFASPNTDQMIAIGASEIITPVLKNVSEQRHIQGWRKRMDALCFDPLLGQAVRDVLSRPVGGFAHIKWGGMGNVGQDIDPSLSLMGKSSLLFRFGARCRNPNCSNSPLDTE
ncbi:hypothetical protein R3P38DRAFT_2791896 [Favolaschia claudopus]|uniref:Uncharacterized protein n=1 Tax=Favolaschia claudopus TaxID=2862362 RepID=A0AAW0AGV3_9AGAR